MGKLDTLTKQYMSQPEIFADAFNYLLYNGERVIMPDALRSVDTTEEISNVKFKRVYDEKGDVDMCKGMELHDMDIRIENTIEVLREMGVSEEEIAERVAKKFDVSIDYVKDLMMPKAV